MTDTPNLGLRQPTYGDDDWDTLWNQNATILDSAVGKLVFFARRTSSLSVANNTLTPVPFNSIIRDPFGFWSGTWPIVPAGMAGVYMVSISFAWAANSTGFRALDIGGDSVQDLDAFQLSMPATPSPAVTAYTGTWVSPGNPVGGGFYTQVTQSSGSSLVLSYCSFALTRMGS